MSRVRTNGRTIARVVVVGLVASLILASCGSTTKVVPRATGLPAISISVPLSVVGCTTENSCATLGTSSLDAGPTSVGEYRLASGRWSALSVPSATESSYLQSASCWNSGCLFVGQQSSGDLVWRYDATTHTVSALTPPAGGTGIQAVSCVANSCTVIDATSNGPRYLTTTDRGTSWAPANDIGVPSQDTVTSLACTKVTTCIASFLNAANGIEVAVSSDGGLTWTVRSPLPTTKWSALTSLNCHQRSCLGLAKLSTGWRTVATDNLGRTWKKVASVPSSVLTLSCTTLAHCLVGGMTGSGAPWLASLSEDIVTPYKLQYIPTPIVDVSCGASICSAIGVTTVIALRP